jgi:hypothetical protein
VVVIAHAGPRRRLVADALDRLARVDLARVRKVVGVVLVAGGVALLASPGWGLMAAAMLVGVGR